MTQKEQIHTPLEALIVVMAPGAWQHQPDCDSVPFGEEFCDCGYMDRVRLAQATIAKAKAEAHIDGMSQLEMARLWRFAPAGHPYFVTDSPLADYFSARFRGFTPEISKMLG